MNTNELNQTHDKAMDLASRAWLARQRGQENEARLLFQQAFELERQVAIQLSETTIEPSRSVLLRSAATLALDCGEIQSAETLIAIALAGNPPLDIREELRDLMRLVLDALREKAAGD